MGPDRKITVGRTKDFPYRALTVRGVSFFYAFGIFWPPARRRRHAPRDPAHIDGRPMTGPATVLLSDLESALQQSDSPEQFVRRLASINETSDESIWELLAVLDQYYRRGRIPNAYFQAARTSIQRRAMGLPPIEEETSPNPVIAEPAASVQPEPVPEPQIDTATTPTTALDSMSADLPHPAIARESAPPQRAARPSSPFRIFRPGARGLVVGALCFAAVVAWSLRARESTRPTLPTERIIPSVGSDKVPVVLAERAARTFSSTTALLNEMADATDDAAASENSVAPDQTAPAVVPKEAPAPAMQATPVAAVHAGAKPKLPARAAVRPSAGCAEALLRASLSPGVAYFSCRK